MEELYAESKNVSKWLVFIFEKEYVNIAVFETHRKSELYYDVGNCVTVLFWIHHLFVTEELGFHSDW